MTIDLLLQVPMAVLATWRLTELIVVDDIAKPLRNRVKAASCARCASVWAGIACTVTLLWMPWLNWPLGLSWVQLFMTSHVEHGRYKKAYEQLSQQAQMIFQENQNLKHQMNGGQQTHA